MSNGVPVRYRHRPEEERKQIGCASIAGFFIFAWILIWLFATNGPNIYAFSQKHSVKIIYSTGALIATWLTIWLFLNLYKRMKETRMLERLMMNPDEKEFAKITRDLSRDKYIALKAYFKATGTPVESANKFLKSCRGVAFLDAYIKENSIDNITISNLILDVEREEQIVSCAVDILKTYS
jgi:hypothetical protein